VGLGEDAQETLDAVERGFVVFGFEPSYLNFNEVLDAIKKRGMSKKVRVVRPVKNGDGTWVIEPPMKLPDDYEGGGFAFIINMAADAEPGTILMSSTRGNVLNNIASDSSGDIAVAKLPIDAVIPSWVKVVALLKIDTQGWDLRVMRSAEKLIKTHKVRCVQYEFSPLLMKMAKDANVGEPFEALQYLPSLGGTCFDMMGAHTNFGSDGSADPSFPPGSPRSLKNYYDFLTRHIDTFDDEVGPWEDIMCYFPLAQGRPHTIKAETKGTERDHKGCEKTGMRDVKDGWFIWLFGIKGPDQGCG